MKTPFIISDALRRCWLCLLFALCVAPAQAQLEWRVSVKIILGPANEIPCCGDYDSAVKLTNRINEANAMMQALGRGYK